jgi:hypothetical protein
MQTGDASMTADVAPHYDILENIGSIELPRDENYDLASQIIAIDTSTDSSFRLRIESLSSAADFRSYTKFD